MRRHHVLVCACIAAAACSSPSPAPPPPSTPDPGPAPAGTERITGSERLGWNQNAANGEELATFRYLIYVDNNANEAQGVTCSSTAGPGGFACTGRLPSMTPGQHALTLSSFIESGGARLESPRSPAVNVLLVSQSTASLPDNAGGVLQTVDGVRFRSTPIVEGLDEAVDLAFAPDGRLFIAERGGRVRVVRNGRMVPRPALVVSDVSHAEGHGLLAVAVDPEYAANRFVYLVYTTARGFRLARLRAVGDTLGDRAILLDEVPASSSRPAAALRFGPDRRLYLGMDDGGDVGRAGDLGSFNGKVLRLNADASTPSDQTRLSPVLVPSVSRPRGVAWGASGLLWVLDRADAGGGLLEAALAAGNVVSRYRLPDEADATSVAVYRGDLFPAFRENLFVAAAGERSILRMTLDPDNPQRITTTERLPHPSFDDIRALAVGPDGAIYVCTARALLKLSPSN